MILKRRSTSRRIRTAAKPTARTKPKRRTKSSRGKPRRKQDDMQARAFQAFAEQADSLWSRLADQCRQFADGFNHRLGSAELKIEADASSLRAAYPKADAELVVTLDRSERYVQCRMNSGCSTGACNTDQPPVGMTVRGHVLHWAFAGDVVSDERLAITLLTELTRGDGQLGS